MKNNDELRLYLFAQTTLVTEWYSLMGHKYRHALPFAWSFAESIEEANVVAWDGLMNTKGACYLDKVANTLKSRKKVLLLQREALTLFLGTPWVKGIDIKEIRFVELSSGNVLPEDLLMALEQCHEKLKNG